MTFENRTDLEIFSRTRAVDFPLEPGIRLTRIAGRCWMLVPEVDKGFSHHLREDGFWEAWVTRCLTRLVRPGWKCVNVGAHYGYFSILLGQLSKEKLIAFEPQKFHANLLRRSAAMNELEIDVREQAVGTPGRRRFYSHESGTMNASLIHQSLDYFDTEVVALDDVIPAADLIFVDAEGAEVEIMAGCTRLREHSRIILEVASGRAYPTNWIDKLADEFNLRWINYNGDIEGIARADACGTPADCRMLYLSHVD